MMIIRHIPRPSGVLPLGRYMQLLTMHAIEHAYRIEQQERERLQANITIHIPEPRRCPETLPRFSTERRERMFEEMRMRRTVCP